MSISILAISSKDAILDSIPKQNSTLLMRTHYFIACLGDMRKLWWNRMLISCPQSLPHTTSLIREDAELLVLLLHYAQQDNTVSVCTSDQTGRELQIVLRCMTSTMSEKFLGMRYVLNCYLSISWQVVTQLLRFLVWAKRQLSRSF